MLLVFLLLMLCLSACGNKNQTMNTEYDNPADYAGVYYSGISDGRALILYDDGRYEWYSVPVGGTPQPSGDGVFKPRQGMINFGFLDSEGNFVIDNQLPSYTDMVREGVVEFVKQQAEPDTVILEEFTAMPVSMETYLGEWENDSLFGWLTITEADYTLTYPLAFSSGSFIKGPDYLLLGTADEQKRLTATGEGGLKLEGTEGIYYPKGDDRLEDAPYKAFVGNWSNEATNDAIQFGEDGLYAVVTAGMNDDGSIKLNMSSGIYEVRDGILMFTQDGIEYTAEISDGVLHISGIDGFFIKG